MLSNNKGHDLVQHLKAVANLARGMAVKLGLPSDLVERAYTSGLLHDIGKCVPSFQEHMRIVMGTELLIVDDDFQDPVSIGVKYPLHHEASWAFLTSKIGDKVILNSVYWHHARPVHEVEGKKSTYDMVDDIVEGLRPGDLEALEGLWSELLPLVTCGVGNLLAGTIEVPDLFEKDGGLGNRDDNAKFMLVRACVISADRHVSGLESVGALANGVGVEEEIEDLMEGGISGEAVCPADYDRGRYDSQVAVVGSVGDSRTTIIKAPAGYGKTLIGILWSKARGGKTIWVCPRNAVARAVYDNIVRELSVLGLSCSVELFLTGMRQDPGDGEREGFVSDIIVTNIDSVMSPMVNNKVAGRLFTVFGSNVVLDEFHEFVSDAPLFASFVTYMRARHRVAETCKTLLLSATPSLVQKLWDTGNRATLILPNGSSHYPPQHEGVYGIGFSEEFPSVVVPGSLLVCNSVSETQENYGLGYTHIIHHRYTDADRERLNATVFSSFGKNCTGVSRGESLSAALVVQAAMDLSFKDLFDSVCSPESTLQRIGRTDRWGTFQGLGPRITFMDINKKTERAAIRTVYDGGLQEKWMVFLRQELAGVSSVNLARMYEIYNRFYEVYRQEVMSFLIAQYKTGMNGPKNDMEFMGLVGFIPLRIRNIDPEKRKSAYKNLRNPVGSYFYTVELVGQPNVWLGPDDVMSEGHELYDRYVGKGELTSELLNTGHMLTRLRGLVACGYDSWNRQSRSRAPVPGSLKDWFKKARYEVTPLPDFSRKYDSILGTIKRNNNS